MTDTPILMKQYGVDVVALLFAVGGVLGTFFGVAIGLAISMLVIRVAWRWVLRYLVGESVFGGGRE